MNDESDRNKQPNLNQDSLNTGITGWLWVKQGFEIFRKQPAEMLSLFFGYMFVSLAVGLIPVLGQVLPILLIPTLMMGFMHACRQSQKGTRVNFSMLFEGFRSPAFSRLLTLGVFYILAALLVLGISSLADDGMLWDVMVMQKVVDEAAIRNSGMLGAMLLAAIAYIPALMAFWFAGPLIMWNGMSVGKAVFYSFFAVKRSGRAFLVFGSAWLLIGVFLPMFASVLIGAIANSPVLVMIIMVPVSLGLTAVMYCSFYPTYTDSFGAPEVDVIMKEDE